MGDYRDEARERLKEKSKGKYFKMTEGETEIRILPNALDKPGKPPKRPYIEFAMHYNVGPKKRAVVCGMDVRTKEGECWLCTQVEKKLRIGKKTKNKAVIKRAEAMVSASQLGLQIASKGPNEKNFTGPSIWTLQQRSSAMGLDARLISMIGDKKRIIADPKKGFNFTIERVGTGLATKYPRVERDEEPSEVSAKILKGIKSFDELIGEYDEEKQKNAYFGREDDDEDTGDDEDEDDSPKNKKKSKKSKDEDDDDEDEDDSDDEEEDEDDDDEPKKKSKGKKKKSSEEDDEEEDDDDSGDEDEDSGDDDDDSDEDDEADDEDDDDGPSKKKSKKSAKPSSKKSKSKSDDDEDDDEDEEDDEASDEDEEDPDDDDVDDDDDEDEEDEPKKKAVKKTVKRKK